MRINKFGDVLGELSKSEALDEIERVYGYRPDMPHENWTIFKNNLIVANPNHPPRLFRPGCNGAYVEIRP